MNKAYLTGAVPVNKALLRQFLTKLSLTQQSPSLFCAGEILLQLGMVNSSS